ncbi:predicted protein [Verticillium alfalfae VaMs.102]|uniref:Predicted protein n=1 Tax=Verticillium alfalfae (strain VaMs.102 / ATCC MYA-4576 / FGSC 10136) TaxID=526221 RepID=C9SLZ0_VERA1|nr:predicted protein [Verticillium alfalfae VaMs.102]EEY19805.1 predicted protein [Verticillium alfalfae VaMs.102]
MARNVCITAAEGQTGFLIAELLLKHSLSRKVDSVTAFTMDPTSDRVKALDSPGATVVAEAEKVLQALSESDNMERQSILDYFSLVRKGKISPTAFHDVTGTHPTEPTGFFKMRSGALCCHKSSEFVRRLWRKNEKTPVVYPARDVNHR